MINTEGDFSETPSPVVSAPHPTQNIRDIDLYKVRYIYLYNVWSKMEHISSQYTIYYHL